MGVPWVLATEEQIKAFRLDWEVYGLTLEEMAALHGFRNINSVSRAARRLGLKKRTGGRPVGSGIVVLSGGRWKRTPGGIKVWEPN